MYSSPNLLCFSKNPELLDLRRRVLATRYDVTAVNSLQQIEALPTGSVFDVLVLCHSLSILECSRGSRLARCRWPDIKVLAITLGTFESQGIEADISVGSLRGPIAMFGQISQPARSAASLIEVLVETRESGVTLACNALKQPSILDGDFAAPVCYGPGSLQRAGYQVDTGSPHTQHLRKKILCQRQYRLTYAILHHQQPPGHSCLNFMQTVAAGYLLQHVSVMLYVKVDGMHQRRVLQKRFVKPPEFHAQGGG